MSDKVLKGWLRPSRVKVGILEAASGLKSLLRVSKRESKASCSLAIAYPRLAEGY